MSCLLLAAGTLTTGSLTLTDVQVLKWTPSTQDADRQLAWQDDAGSSPSSPTIPAVHPAGQDNGRRRAASESSAVAAAARMAMQYCVSASMTSNHPVSRAVVAAGGSLANQKGQQVTAFEQVRACDRLGQPCPCRDVICCTALVTYQICPYACKQVLVCGKIGRRSAWPLRC